MTSSPSVVRRAYTNMELLRFLAAFAVVLHHYYLFSWSTPNTPLTARALPSVAGIPVGEWFYRYGGAGVSFFWLLSGFIFFSQYATKIADRAVDAAKFTALRFSRLYPLHLATMLLVILLQVVYVGVHRGGAIFGGGSITLDDIVGHLTMTSHWDADSSVPTLNLPIWSVSVEILVYLVFFIMMRHAPKLTVRLAWVSPLALLAVFNGEKHLVLVALVLFFCGGGVFYLTNLVSKSSSGFRGILIGITAVGIAISVATPSHRDANAGASLFLFLVVVLAALLPQLDGRAGRLAEHLGSTTYSSYLLHYPLLLLIVVGYTAAGVAVPWPNNWTLLLAWVSVTYALAFVVYHKFELPAQTWIREQFPSTRRKPATSPAGR